MKTLKITGRVSLLRSTVLYLFRQRSHPVRGRRQRHPGRNGRPQCHGGQVPVQGKKELKPTGCAIHFAAIAIFSAVLHRLQMAGTPCSILVNEGQPCVCICQVPNHPYPTMFGMVVYIPGKLILTYGGNAPTTSELVALNKKSMPQQGAGQSPLPTR